MSEQLASWFRALRSELWISLGIAKQQVAWRFDVCLGHSGFQCDSLRLRSHKCWQDAHNAWIPRRTRDNVADLTRPIQRGCQPKKQSSFWEAWPAPAGRHYNVLFHEKQVQWPSLRHTCQYQQDNLEANFVCSASNLNSFFLQYLSKWWIWGSNVHSWKCTTRTPLNGNVWNEHCIALQEPFARSLKSSIVWIIWQVRDLLRPDSDFLDIREDPVKGMCVAGWRSRRKWVKLGTLTYLSMPKWHTFETRDIHVNACFAPLHENVDMPNVQLSKKANLSRFNLYSWCFDGWKHFASAGISEVGGLESAEELVCTMVLRCARIWALDKLNCLYDLVLSSLFMEHLVLGIAQSTALVNMQVYCMYTIVASFVYHSWAILLRRYDILCTGDYGFAASGQQE